MKTDDVNKMAGALRTSAAARAIGIATETLIRWTHRRDERGAALRKARLSRGWYSTARLREAGLLS